jgi:hypothetical protein
MFGQGVCECLHSSCHAFVCAATMAIGNRGWAISLVWYLIFMTQCVGWQIANQAKDKSNDSCSTIYVYCFWIACAAKQIYYELKSQTCISQTQRVHLQIDIYSEHIDLSR